MARDKFALGIDYGTESGRVVVIRVRDGEEIASTVIPYPDGVIDEKLPGGPKLEPDWALQNPRDYFLVLEKGVPKALKAAKVRAEDVVGIGTDFTASSPMPTKRDGTPLCFLREYRKNPHAWVKLWKHHAAQPEANRINEIGRERNEDFIRIYGGKYSSEWFFSKLLQVLDEAAEVYDAMDKFIEAADWIVWQLTGEEKRNTCTAGYRAMWVKGSGFPSPEFFRALHPGKRTERYIRGLARLQDALGELNDAAVARRVLAARAERLARAGSNQAAELHYAAGLVVGWQSHEAARRWHKLVAEWKDCRRLKRFWPKPEGGEEVDR